VKRATRVKKRKGLARNTSFKCKGENFSRFPKVSRQCPLVLLIEARFREGKDLGNEELKFYYEQR
jgi:hypothetical protein